MPFTPRLPNELLQKMRARAVASSKKLTDLAEGGVLGSLLGSVAEEISSDEMHLQEWLNAHFLDAEGSDLDDRVAQLPKEFPRRRGARAAIGGTISVTRVASSGALSIPPGGLVLGRSDLANVFYTNTTTISWIDGQSVAPGVGQDPIQVRCATQGPLGNGGAGVINIVRSPVNLVRSVTSTQPVGQGSNGEGDAALRRRARLWISSLMGWTPRALEGLALNYTSANGDALKHARAVTDPANPGYTSLVVDDGFGMLGYTEDAATTTGTVPTLQSGSRHQFPFDYPAVGGVQLTLAGTTYGPSSTDWIAILEKGVLITANNPVGITLTPGIVWSIGGHRKYVGLLAEVQQYLDDIAVGAGLRVRVIPPRLETVTITANVVVLAGYVRTTVHAAVKSTIISYFIGLAPGEAAQIFELCALLERVSGVDNVIFDRVDGWYPGSLSNKLSTTAGSITLR